MAQSTAPAISVRQATQAATAYLSDLQGWMGGLIDDIRLEEVELSEDSERWYITLSFARPAMNQLVPSQVQRDYKIFEVSATTGEIKAMKIRTL
jgi:hypothetical protein